MRMLLPLILLVPGPALAQADGSVPTEVQSPAASAAAQLSVDMPIEEVMADPVGKAVMDKEMPALMSHPAYEQFKSMSLRQLQPYSGGAITEEKVAAVQSALEAARDPKS